MSALDIPLSSVSMETVIRHGAAVQAMTLAGFTALVYDHILTFAVEVDLIWRTRVGLVSTIFLLNRYIVPLMLVVDIYEFFGLHANSALFCKVWTALQSFLTIASFMSIHSIVAMRVYALYNGERWISRILWTAGVIYCLSSTSIVVVSEVQIIPDLQPVHHTCVGSIPSYLWMVWLPSVIFETFLFGLTVYAMLVQDKRHSFNTLTLILYRDGMFYFFAVAFCSLFSLLVWALADPTLLGLARYFALAIVNIAGSRLVLNLKAYAAEKKDRRRMRTPLPLSAIAFTPTRQSPQEAGDISNDSVASISPFDLEMYSIERECQQLGTRLH